jgi:hypothetical protein
VLELQLGVAKNLGRTDLTATLERAIEDVWFASEAELEPVAGAIREMRNYGDSLQRLDESIQKAFEEGEVRSLKTSSFTSTTNNLPVDLTPPTYFDGGITGIHCPSQQTGGRNNTEVIINAKIAVGLAKTVWAPIEIACGLDVVALASGGLGTLGCAAAALIPVAAEEVVDALVRCDETVDEAHLDAAFERAEDNFELGTHIHGDLKTHDDYLVQHDTDIKALLFEIAENQREIIKLLKTPQGNRPGWNKEGYQKRSKFLSKWRAVPKEWLGEKH